MSEDPLSPPAPPPLPPRRRSCLVPALIALLVAVLIALGLWWWYNRPIQPVELTSQESQVLNAKIETLEAPPPAEPQYEPGSKEIILTERELNGLLHQNTGLGDRVHFELATDAIHARVETDLDPEVPVVGGRKLKARARFFVRNDDLNRPSLVLDDLTVWGVSVPNDWIGGMKGRDLLSEILGEGNGVSGIEEFRIEPGRLILRLAE